MNEIDLERELIRRKKRVKRKESSEYEEEIIYDINGAINFDSSLDIPLPIGFIDNDIIINVNY